MIREGWWPYAAAGYTPAVTATNDEGRPTRAVCPACDTDVPVSDRGWLTPHGAGRVERPCDGSFMPVPADGAAGVGGTPAAALSTEQ